MSKEKSARFVKKNTYLFFLVKGGVHMNYIERVKQKINTQKQKFQQDEAEFSRRTFL